MYDAIVIGAGFSGSVISRFMAERGARVLLMERRHHIAGNMYDYLDENEILVQKYGPHAFHTKNNEIYKYLTSFCEFSEYRLTGLAYMNGIYTPVPFNFKTIDDYFSERKAESIKSAIKRIYGDLPKAPVFEMMNSKELLVKEFAEFLFHNDYKLYTAKQWGVPPSEIDASILKRVPVLFSYDIGFFDDKFQALPVGGFTKLFGKILDHPNIFIQLNTDAKQYLTIDTEYKRALFRNMQLPIIYTGAVDELLDYRLGALPYRSLRFEHETLHCKNYQDAPTVAYPQTENYTRITEYTKLPYQDRPCTRIAKEYSVQHDPGEGTEPYYPIISDVNCKCHQKYMELLSEIPNLYLCGRLADYKYYNMDQAIERAFEICYALHKDNVI